MYAHLQLTGTPFMQEHWPRDCVRGCQAWWSHFTICACELELCLCSGLILTHSTSNVPCYSLLMQSVGNQAIPIFLMGVLAVLAGFCALKLPETKDSPTPDTLEEMRVK